MDIPEFKNLQGCTAFYSTILQNYHPELVRSIVTRLLRPRSQWPNEELIQRWVQSLDNPVVIDRRLKELGKSAHTVLWFSYFFQRTWWDLNLVLTMLASLGYEDSLQGIESLFQSGFLLPIRQGNTANQPPILNHFQQWLSEDAIQNGRFFLHPSLIMRAANFHPDWPILEPSVPESKIVHTCDGLDFFLRIGVVHQQLSHTPIHLTQAKLFYKRDLTKLQNDPLLNAPIVNHLTDLPDAGILFIQLALLWRIIQDTDNELKACPMIDGWQKPMPIIMRQFLSLFAELKSYDPFFGYNPDQNGVLPSLMLLTFALLANQNAQHFFSIESIAKTWFDKHVVWKKILQRKPEELSKIWLEKMLLGIFYPLGWLDVSGQGTSSVVRLSTLARDLISNAPAAAPSLFPGIIVQPNSEIMVYRQGLNPDLIAKLTCFATWKMLGSACVLELQPEQVYRGLEAGLGYNEIIQLLQKNSSRNLPSNVIDILQRWSKKRDRLSVYTNATLVEFVNPLDLENAFKKELISIKLTDHIGLITANEIDYKSFRLLGNRDYESQLYPCISFETDGVTFKVDRSHSDLLLEAEIPRYSEAVPHDSIGERYYRITPEIVQKLKNQGISSANFNDWFMHRAGIPMTPSVKMMFQGISKEEILFAEYLIFRVPNPSIADGLMQWPASRALILEQIGPCHLAIAHNHKDSLIELLQRSLILTNSGIE